MKTIVNKILRISLLMVIILTVTPPSHSKEINVVVDQLKYTISTIQQSATCLGPQDGTDLIIEDLIIPEYVTYNNEKFPVRAINNRSFEGCSQITGSLKIPNSVIYIYYGAFKDCSGLTGSLIIPGSVKQIDAFAFSGCTNLKELKIEFGEEPLLFNGYSDADGTFKSCQFETIHLGRNFTFDSIYHQPLCNFESLESISFGDEVTTLDNGIFNDCPKLCSVSIPNTIMSIDDAFNNCLNLKNLIFEDGRIKDYPLSISNRSFVGCKLESMYIGRDLDSSDSCSPFHSINKSALSTITISESVSRIGDETFEGCTALSSISIPKSIKSIGDNAFKGCTALKELIFEGNTEPLSTGVGSIGESAFEGCAELSSFTIPNTVTSIGNNAFKGCTALKELIFEDATDPMTLGGCSIGECAFEGCTGLSSLSIPNTVTSIGNNAFKECAALKELVLKDGTESLSLGYGNKNSFGDICGLFSDVPLETIYLGRNISFSIKPFKLLNETLVDITISNSVTTIPDYTFYGCRGLTSVSIGESVVSIGSNAFAFCTNLTSVTLPNSLTSIGTEAFLGTDLGKIVIPDSVVSIGSQAFGYCKKLDVVSIGKSLRAISTDVFLESHPDTVKTYTYYIDGIESSGLRQDVKVILKTDTDFSGIGSTNLTYFNELVLNDGDTEYGLVISPQNLDFAHCIFSEGDKYVVPLSGSNARMSSNSQYILFRGEDMTEKAAGEDGFSFSPSVFHKENVFSVYGDSETSSLTQTIHLDEAGTLFSKLDFNNIEKLEVLTLSGDINGTDVMTINRMSSLKYLDMTNANIVEGGMTYRDNLKTVKDVIGERFFSDINLEVVHLPMNAIKIDKEAFAGMPLKLVTIPASITSIGNSAFLNCSDITLLTIPNSVLHIGDKAFSGCSGIEHLVIEDGKNELAVGSEPFYYCKFNSLYLGRNLSYTDSPFKGIYNPVDVTISDSVTSIGDRTFQNTGLKSVVIPETVTAIGECAFAGCWELETMEMPESLKSLGKRAFYNCALKSISIPSGIKKIEDEVFAECYLLESISIEGDVTSIGTAAFKNCWSLTSLQIPESVKSIESEAFSDCSSLSSISVPDGIEKIEDEVCKGCVGLSTIRIPESVESIGTNAFSGCSSLAEVNIPDSITSIGEYAFYNTALKEVLLPAAVKKIGDYAFAGNTGITKVISLNTTPPEIFTNTFDSEIETLIPLHVQKGSLMYYWLDPVWKEFKNISDDVLCLQPIPDARYGDGETDLAQYAPEGAALTYTSSNEDVVKIKGSVMQIVGAGTATVEANPGQEESHMELVGQMRQIFVDKTDLIITVDEIVIEPGSPVPDFTYLAEGLKYDDTIEDIDILPQPIHNVDENSPIGEYAVSFTDGSDGNYRITTRPSKITVTTLSGVRDNGSDVIEQDIEVYDLEGLLIYRGPRREAILQKGIYIVRQGKVARKITVR